MCVYKYLEILKGIRLTSIPVCTTVYQSVYPIDSHRESVWWWHESVASTPLLPMILAVGAIYDVTIHPSSTPEGERAMKDAVVLRSFALKALGQAVATARGTPAEALLLVICVFHAIEVRLCFVPISWRMRPRLTVIISRLWLAIRLTSKLISKV